MKKKKLELSPDYERIMNKARAAAAPSVTATTARTDIRKIANLISSRLPRRGHGMREVVRRYFEHLKQKGQPTTVDNLLLAMRQECLKDRLIFGLDNPSAWDFEVNQQKVFFFPVGDEADAAKKQLLPGTLKQYLRDFEKGGPKK